MNELFLHQVPDVIFIRNGEEIYKCNAIRSIDMYDDEIIIDGLFMQNVLNRGDVLDLKLVYRQKNFYTKENCENFIEEKKDFILYRINRDSSVDDVVRSTYKFIR